MPDASAPTGALAPEELVLDIDDLRPSRIDGARHAAAVIKLLVARLRRAWPNTRLIVRA